MILTNNLHWLNNQFPRIFKQVNDTEEQDIVMKVESKSDFPTLFIEEDGVNDYIHSKYNPKYEAEKFVEIYKQIEFEHVLFYGCGLGYHIEEFVKLHPSIPFTIYEPNIAIFKLFLGHSLLEKWPQLKYIYLQTNSSECLTNVTDFVKRTSGQALVITLPSYERIFNDEHTSFVNNMTQQLTERHKYIDLQHVFEKKWMINSLDNIPFTLSATNIFDKRSFFEGKPVLMVAAGPSLNDELENLREIKSRKSAYLFAIGSAFIALLQHGIVPDGICTYDPHNHNVIVFKKIIDEQITNIPLIYGTTAGTGTLIKYPGPTLYMVSDRDDMASLLLRNVKGEALEKVNDAPTIAVVALQLFHGLGCNRIIMVGQNLAFRNHSYYASGIQHEGRNEEISEQELKDAILIEDVEGKPIYTNWQFNAMRVDIEQYISQYNNVDIINTTQGGAKIKGTRFINLKNVIQEFLNEEVVVSNWYEGNPTSIDLTHLKEKSVYLESERIAVLKKLEECRDILKQLNRSVKVKNIANITKSISQFRKTFDIVQENGFYQTILKSMNLLQLKLFVQQMDTIRLETNIYLKAKKIILKFGKLIEDTQRDFELIEPYYTQMQVAIKAKTDHITV